MTQAKQAATTHTHTHTHNCRPIPIAQPHHALSHTLALTHTRAHSLVDWLRRCASGRQLWGSYVELVRCCVSAAAAAAAARLCSLPSLFSAPLLLPLLLLLRAKCHPPRCGLCVCVRVCLRLRTCSCRCSCVVVVVVVVSLSVCALPLLVSPLSLSLLSHLSSSSSPSLHFFCSQRHDNQCHPRLSKEWISSAATAAAASAAASLSNCFTVTETQSQSQSQSLSHTVTPPPPSLSHNNNSYRALLSHFVSRSLLRET